MSGTLALALVFALGWTIFDGPLRGQRLSSARQTASGYLLLPLVAGLSALGAGITDVVTHGEAPSSTARWLLCGATAFTLLTIAIIELVQSPDAINRRLLLPRILATIAALLVGLLGARGDTVALLALLVLVTVAQMLLGLSAFGSAEIAVPD